MNDKKLQNKSLHIKQSGVEFLMSIAGMFDSGYKDTSENAKSIVTKAILEKHRKAKQGFID